MMLIPYSVNLQFTPKKNLHLLITVLLAFFMAGLLIATSARADSVMALPDGGENIMVTFDELDQTTPFPVSHRGVQYTPTEADGWGIWVVQDMPITRFVKSPMLALTAFVEEPDEPTKPISLLLEFEQPTQFFGFGLGFNNRLQIPDGSILPEIGSVVLNFSNGKSQIFPISATRVVCCTELRFDYSDTTDGILGNGLVESATITLEYKYDPFAPGSGYPGMSFGLKFMGIDDVTYSTAIIPTTMEVEIDIKPNKEPNVINLASANQIPVAILTDQAFDALQVNPETARLGQAGVLAASYRVKDVDRDGDEDLVLYYMPQYLEFACTDTQTFVTCELYDGTPVAGIDSILIKNCQ